MSQGTLVPAELRSGNPALSDAFIESQLSPAVAAPRTLSIAGVGVKTHVLLAVVVAAGAWGWASATETGDQLRRLGHRGLVTRRGEGSRW